MSISGTPQAVQDAPSSAWESWTPTLTNMTLGNGTVTAAYTRSGRDIHFRFKFVLGSTSAVGTNPLFTLPATAATAYADDTDNIGICESIDTGGFHYGGPVWLSGTRTQARLLVWNAAATRVSAEQISAGVPLTFATGDALVASGTYEAAS